MQSFVNYSKFILLLITPLGGVQFQVFLEVLVYIATVKVGTPHVFAVKLAVLETGVLQLYHDMQEFSSIYSMFSEEISRVTYADIKEKACHIYAI